MMVGRASLLSYPEVAMWHYDYRHCPTYRPFETTCIPEVRDRRLPCVTILLYVGRESLRGGGRGQDGTGPGQALSAARAWLVAARPQGVTGMTAGGSRVKLAAPDA